jgi:hypothetical protein
LNPFFQLNVEASLYHMGAFVACGLAQNPQPPQDIPRVMEIAKIIRAGNPAAARRVSGSLGLLNRRLNEMPGFNFFLTEACDEIMAAIVVNQIFLLGQPP